MNTRFRPTPYRDMHVGHAWVAWHNYRIAAGSGGRFAVIVDDMMYYLQDLAAQSWPLTTAVMRYVEDLTWIGMPPDEVVYSTRNAEAHADAAQILGLQRPGQLSHEWCGTVVPRVNHTGASDQYNAWLVMVRVVDDYIAGVDGFFRGADILPEMFLYDDTCRRLGYRTCGQEYLPVIRREGNDKKESKSTGATSVRALREAGYTPEQIIATLRECARRSALAGLAHVVVPAGVLEAGEIKALPYEYYSSPTVLRGSHHGEPFCEGLIGYHRRMKQRERRRHA